MSLSRVIEIDFCVHQWKYTSEYLINISGILPQTLELYCLQYNDGAICPEAIHHKYKLDHSCKVKGVRLLFESPHNLLAKMGGRTFRTTFKTHLRHIRPVSAGLGAEWFYDVSVHPPHNITPTSSLNYFEHRLYLDIIQRINSCQCPHCIHYSSNTSWGTVKGK